MENNVQNYSSFVLSASEAFANIFWDLPYPFWIAHPWLLDSYLSEYSRFLIIYYPNRREEIEIVASEARICREEAIMTPSKEVN